MTIADIYCMLSDILCHLGSLPPSLTAMLSTTANRYSVPGNIIKSPRGSTTDYIQSLSTDNSTKKDHVAAWTRSANFAA